MAERRRRKTRPEQQAETRALILDAAVSVCTRRGLHDATVEEISEEAGFTRGAVYSNFDGKEGLLLALFEERLEPRLRAMAAPMRAAGSTEERARTMGEFIGEVASTDREYLLLLAEFWGYAARRPKLKSEFAGSRCRRRESVGAMIEDRLRRTHAEARVPTSDLAAAFIALTVGVLFESLVDDDLEPDRLYAIGFELLLRGSASSDRTART